MMEILRHTLSILHLAALALLFVYGANAFVLLLARRRREPRACKRPAVRRRRFAERPPDARWPRVTVQLPVFNERCVVERLIDTVAQLDYPAPHLEIQVLDDSTDDTTRLARHRVRRLRARGVNIRCLHRNRRDGFKAGALRDGLACAPGEFIAVFDADFLPPRDFLKRMLPHFADPGLGMIQARWSHANDDTSLLTRIQAVAIDAHFMIEQAARAWSGWFMSFNGSAGVWRRAAIEDAGGWQADTLTEDLDLSYRAQLKGWRLGLDLDLACAAELPVTFTALKAQQRRWAKGSIQTAKKTLGRLMAAPLPWSVKLQAGLHLTRYAVHPLILLALLTSVPMLYTPFFPGQAYGPALLLAALWLASLGPSILAAASQRLLYPDWKRRVACLPALACLGVGMSVGNSLAVLEALFNIDGPFVRTPKFGVRRHLTPVTTQEGNPRT